MKFFLAAFLFFFVVSCSKNNRSVEEQKEVKLNIDSTFEDVTKIVTTKTVNLVGMGLDSTDLINTKWYIKVYPECIDTLIFESFNTGREYRCEFQIDNNFTYLVESDTLLISEYGYISEVDASKGKEIKHIWKYILLDSGLFMVNDRNESFDFLYKPVEN